MTPATSVPFDEACADVSGGQKKIKKADVLPAGSIPVVDQGESFIAGYAEDPELAFKGDLPVIVFGDHTRRFKFVEFPFALGADGVKVLSPRQGFDARYLFHSLRALDIPGVGYSRHFKFLKKCEIPRPSMEDQRRIARLLDLSEAARSRGEEPHGLLVQYESALFLDMFGDPSANPKNWETAPLTTACRPISGGTPPKTDPESWDGEIPWFSAKDLKQAELSDSKDHISEHGLSRARLRLLDPRTVVMLVRGMTLAHTVPIALLTEPATINQDIKALLPEAEIEPEFLAACLRAQSGLLLGLVSTSAHGTKRLDTRALESVQVILPPRLEQERFAEATRAIRDLQARYHKRSAKLDALFSSLQWRAFKGEL